MFVFPFLFDLICGFVMFTT
jgi:hypothetical protein